MDEVVRRLADVCADVTTDPTVLAGATSDRWPMARSVGRPPLAVARPASASEVAAVLAVCSEDRVPVTPAGGRSGVCGGAVPVHGGVVVDVRGLAGLVAVDEASLLADVGAGAYGDAFEARLRDDHGLTCGHRPQSMALSTVGGWLACRSAGQLSTRYGKIEDMVVGLEVALADGRVVRTGGAPRAATGPDLTQLFVGSEGTLGVITEARLRLHPAPEVQRRAAYGFASFAEGLDACRRILRRGARPAVLRLYDATESQRSFGDGRNVLIVLDEGDAALVDPAMAVVADECAPADTLDPGLADRWVAHRDDTVDVDELARQGVVGDTMEVAVRWSALPALYHDLLAAVRAVEGTVYASAHHSHAYPDGGCLYVAFAGTPPGDASAQQAWYVAAWDALAEAARAHGAALSHHHGIGLAKGRLLPAALGPAHGVLVELKRALDPAGVLNPGKLGLPDPFGDVGWPPSAFGPRRPPTAFGPRRPAP